MYQASEISELKLQLSLIYQILTIPPFILLLRMEKLFTIFYSCKIQQLAILGLFHQFG